MAVLNGLIKDLTKSVLRDLLTNIAGDFPWILENGAWNDAGQWDDNELWNDS